MNQQEVIRVATRIASLVEREQALLADAAAVRTEYEKLAEDLGAPKRNKLRTPHRPRAEDSAKERVRRFVLEWPHKKQLTAADVAATLGITAVLAGNYLSRLAADGAIVTRQGRGAYVVRGNGTN